MNRYIKKIMAFLLMFVVMVGIIPPVEVFANPQNRVFTPMGQGIENNHAFLPPEGQYNFFLRWIWGPTRRNPSETPGLTSPPAGSPSAPYHPNHHPDAFDIQWRNASAPGGGGLNFSAAPPIAPTENMAQNVPRDPQSSVVDALHTWNFSGSLDPGSIYAFRVIPFHWHYFPVPPWAGPPAPMPSAPPPQRIIPTPHTDMEQNLFMTDIRVEIDSTLQEGFEISWDNPMFGNLNVFSGYRIEIRSASAPEAVNPSLYRDIFPTSDGLTLTNAGRTWSYVFIDESMRGGELYHVRIIPRYGAILIDRQALNQVTLGGTTKSFAFSGRRFEATGPYAATTLSGEVVGNSYVLTWGLPIFRPPNIARVEVWSTTENPGPNGENFVFNETVNTHRLITFAGQDVQTLTFRVDPMPTVRTWFIVRIISVDSAGNEHEIITNPDEFVPGLFDFSIYAPTIRYAVAPAGPPLTIDLTWRAFTRPRYTDYCADIFDSVGPNFVSGTDSDGNQFVIDDDVMFYVYITDDLSRLDDPAMQHLPPIHASVLTRQHLSPIGMPPGVAYLDWFYNSQFAQYFSWESLGLEPLVANRVYYIRIRARRPAYGGENWSIFSYASVFVPPTDPLDLIPQMVPVRVKEVEGLRQITNTTIDIEWNTFWFEVFDVDTNTWHDTVARRGENFVFGRAAETEEDRLPLWDLGDVPLSAVAMMVNQWAGSANIPVRMMDTRPSHINQHFIHVVRYEDMEVAGEGYEAYELYLEGIRNPDGTPLSGAWTGIGLGEETYNSEGSRRWHTVPALIPNTSYVIFFWPQNHVGPSFHPTFTSGTTTTDRPDLDIDPTVPILRVEPVPVTGVGNPGTTDHSIDLSWNGSVEMQYQLRFSELLTDFPGGGYVLIDFTSDLASMVTEHNGRLYFTVDGLFPYTMYYFWIQARAPGLEGFNYSVWSNPVNERTLDIQAPQAPHGLRIASTSSLNAHNAENNTDIQVGVPTELILEWNRIYADIHNENRGPFNAAYEVTHGSATWLTRPSMANTWPNVPSIPTTYIALIEELIPNRRYHIRVWTKLTVTRGANPREVVRSYSYRMQVSDDPEFLDYIQIIIPAPEPPFSSPQIPGQMRRRESETYHYRSFFSGQTDDEYDGDVNAEMFPLPDRDWELIYDPSTSTLTFRFRTNQIDATGARDHNVDQRFISRLVQQRVFTYRLNLSTYNNRPVANAVVEMPYSILSAFHERRIALELTMDNVRVTFAPGALATRESQSLTGIGPDTMARLMVNSGMGDAPALNMGGTYASVPRKINAQIVTPTRTLNFDNFAQPLELAFSLEGQALLMEQNIALYTATDWTGGWERIPANHSPVTGEILFSTHQSGNFAAIAQAAPMQLAPLHPSRDAFLRVNARVAITDMVGFNPDEEVTGYVFNNLVAAVALRRPAVAVYGPVDPDDAVTLTRAQIFVPQVTVSREAGIAALVTLYERSIGRAVQPADFGAPPDLASADASNHLALMKGLNLGFIDGMVRPGEALTMGDFMSILDIIIMDAG